MSATKYLIQKLAEAEVESEEATAASQEAAERSNAACDRLREAEVNLGAHLRERKATAKEEVAA
jgi:hypothetical protein